MRQKLCSALMARANKPNMVFLTGDLGFMALEPLREALGERFINCGVAEQNMMTVAAALAKEAFEVWVYSIAPFCYARPFEQIRNDICLHGLPVRLLGNGGGYGYGVMGSTHHALEDYGVMLALQGMSALVPAFSNDIENVVERAAACTGPCYVRLGRDELQDKNLAPAYAAWRRLRKGSGYVVITVGPLVVSVLKALSDFGDPDIWLVAELPILSDELPQELAESLSATGRLCVIEEHVARGGLGSELCLLLMRRSIALKSFRHVCASRYASGLSGSQDYLREHNGLGQEDMKASVAELIEPP